MDARVPVKEMWQRATALARIAARVDSRSNEL